MSAIASSRITAHLLAFAIAIVVFAPTHAQAESAGCGRVNGGAWSTSLQPFGVGATLTVFTNGDRITFTISGAGQFTLLASSDGSTFVEVLIINPPGHATFVITAPFTVFRILNAAVSGLLNVTATCTPAAQQHGAVTKSFLLGRINGILLSDPGGASLLNRSTTSGPQQFAGGGATGSAGNALPFGGSGFGPAMALGGGRFDDAAADATGFKSIRFAHSLSQLQRNAAQSQDDRMEFGARSRARTPAAHEAASPWDIWVEGRYSAFDDDIGNVGRNGHVGVLYLGGDYRIGSNMIVGALAQFDWAKDEIGAVASRVDGTGWMIGPYLSARFHRNIYFDLRAAWGRSSNDLTVGAATAGFDTSRWLVKGALSGNWLWDRWRITPKAELAYVTESQPGFATSAGTLVQGQDVSLGRLQFGPEIGYRVAHTRDLLIEPFAAIRGVWDFDNPNVAIVDGFVVGPGDFWGRLEGGLNVVTSSGVVVRGLASWDGVGASNYSGYTLHGTVNVPLQ